MTRGIETGTQSEFPKETFAEVAKLLVQAGQYSPEQLAEFLETRAAQKLNTACTRNGGDKDEATFDLSRAVSTFTSTADTWLRDLPKNPAAETASTESLPKAPQKGYTTRRIL